MFKDKAMELVAALRSGDYVQGVGYLQQKDGAACCLGVACLLAGEERILVDPTHRYTFGITREDSGLTAKVRDLFGFHSDVGTRRDGQRLTFPNGSTYYSLAKANDSGITFREIAEYIEVNWEQL